MRAFAALRLAGMQQAGVIGIAFRGRLGRKTGCRLFSSTVWCLTLVAGSMLAKAGEMRDKSYLVCIQVQVELGK